MITLNNAIGIYLWIATNYILNRFDHTHDVETTPKSTVATHERKQTVGTIEIGGASLQIAYEVPENVSLSVQYCKRNLSSMIIDKSNISLEYNLFFCTCNRSLPFCLQKYRKCLLK